MLLFVLDALEKYPGGRTNPSGRQSTGWQYTAGLVNWKICFCVHDKHNIFRIYTLIW